MSRSEPSESHLIARVAKAHRSSEKGVATRVSRAWNIAKYYRSSQLARRALMLVARRLGIQSRSIPDAATFNVDVRDQSAFEALSRIRSESTYRDRLDIRVLLKDGMVRLLNRERPLEWRFNKNEQNKSDSLDGSLLWYFQLHYHEYLLPLALASDNPNERAFDLNLIEQTITSWLDQNLISDTDAHVAAWHPYCIARRLPVWFCLLAMADLGSAIRERMLESAHLQAEFLSRHLEWDLRGNHLLENIRALTLAGCYFETKQSGQWLTLVHKILPQQIEEQVLPYGEHFERCPMYHCQVLGNFLEMMIACQNVDERLLRLIRPVAENMFGFLAEIVHPDGEIPLLGDSCFGEAPSVNCLGQLADEVGLVPNCDFQTADSDTLIGDYWVYRDQNEYLIFDRGPAGAETLPAHAHCDLLTLESSIGGTRWLVDSGLYNYEDDEMRWYCRSSQAHNVVCVDDQNQFDVWSKFRMGYRGWPGQLDQGRDGSFIWATGSHSAYRRLGIKKVSRLIGIEPKSFWYCIDRIERASSQQNRVSGFLHLGPQVQISELESDQSNPDRVRIQLENHQFDLVFFNASSVQLLQSSYCSEFGSRELNTVIEYEFDFGCNIAGWFLIPLPSGTLPRMEIERQSQSDQITIKDSHGGIVHQFNWKKD